eukprot:CAMPEP_0202340264 /NCGR_PEP_ID=MMETSP1126-20121109/1775_1 /ASSEMBLY_ACC=CAM_ASM_000457 /TAXON_ID=3047 /ORGANISM="Dunaliella tertiolecta, Strain CCMP1320" /LENGTH=84 /DNA_ID=CAMNT_0048930939 /DNA_START=1127 /DNA_END=1381 /DNA_ORIENTATION=-
MACCCSRNRYYLAPQTCHRAALGQVRLPGALPALLVCMARHNPDCSGVRLRGVALCWDLMRHMVEGAHRKEAAARSCSKQLRFG